VSGSSAEGEGVVGLGKTNGLHGQSAAAEHSGVWGENVGNGFGVAGSSSGGVGIFGEGGRLAGLFRGDVEVTGDIRLTNADCAEEFAVDPAEAIEPGTVLVIDDACTLTPCSRPYDKRVAGVVSGAAACRPAIVLNRQPGDGPRQPVALAGTVYCKVDASYSAIDTGDLLTTSATPGHAMKATDAARAFGSVIGKALRPLDASQGIIPILVALQ
jgi:hypothetical protein